MAVWSPSWEVWRRADCFDFLFQLKTMISEHGVLFYRRLHVDKAAESDMGSTPRHRTESPRPNFASAVRRKLATGKALIFCLAGRKLGGEEALGEEKIGKLARKCRRR